MSYTFSRKRSWSEQSEIAQRTVKCDSKQVDWPAFLVVVSVRTPLTARNGRRTLFGKFNLVRYSTSLSKAPAESRPGSFRNVAQVLSGGWHQMWWSPPKRLVCSSERPVSIRQFYSNGWTSHFVRRFAKRILL